MISFEVTRTFVDNFAILSLACCCILIFCRLHVEFFLFYTCRIWRRITGTFSSVSHPLGRISPTPRTTPSPRPRPSSPTTLVHLRSSVSDWHACCGTLRKLMLVVECRLLYSFFLQLSPSTCVISRVTVIECLCCPCSLNIARFCFKSLCFFCQCCIYILIRLTFIIYTWTRCRASSVWNGGSETMRDR